MAAAELGIVHFDCAPSYGDGLAERELGAFCRSERDRYIIVTKYGIPVDPIMEGIGIARGPYRVVRALARKLGVGQSRLPPITGAGLRRSVESSLMRLRLDRIDILLLHEPAAMRLPRPIEVLEELSNLRRRGVIRAFGVAGAWNAISDVVAKEPDFAQVLQTSETEWSGEVPPDITYGAVAQASQNAFARSIDERVAVERLQAALRRRPGGVVIVSTTKIDNLRALSRATVSRE
jgi:aryl-alcohol dehydrogenase-like predicted oxidoreductase